MDFDGGDYCTKGIWRQRITSLIVALVLAFLRFYSDGVMAFGTRRMPSVFILIFPLAVIWFSEELAARMAKQGLRASDGSKFFRVIGWLGLGIFSLYTALRLMNRS